MRTLGFIISILFYLLGVGGLFYMIAWIGNINPLISMEDTPMTNSGFALLIDFVLIALFGVQHSVMARKSFKASWTKIVPKHLERSIFVLVSGILCLVITHMWEPIAGTIWTFAEGTNAFYISYALFFAGIAVLLLSTFLINHFELFGLQQAYLHMVARKGQKPRFSTFALYKVVRHPIYFGFFLILWSTPIMSFTHFFLSFLMTGYILVGIYFEEKDLVEEFGQTYEAYRTAVPSLVPFTKVGSRNK